MSIAIQHYFCVKIIPIYEYIHLYQYTFVFEKCFIDGKEYFPSPIPDTGNKREKKVF